MIANRGLHILLQLGPVLRVHCMKESFEADRGRCWNTQHLWGIAAPLLLTGNKVPVPNCNVRGSKRDAVAVFGLLALLIESCQLGQRIPTRQERQRNNCAEHRFTKQGVSQLHATAQQEHVHVVQEGAGNNADQSCHAEPRYAARDSKHHAPRPLKLRLAVWRQHTDPVLVSPSARFVCTCYERRRIRNVGNSETSKDERFLGKPSTRHQKGRESVAAILSLAGMAELADALDLGSSAERRAGSSPVPGTTHFDRFFIPRPKFGPHRKHRQREYRGGEPNPNQLSF